MMIGMVSFVRRIPSAAVRLTDDDCTPVSTAPNDANTPARDDDDDLPPFAVLSLALPPTRNTARPNALTCSETPFAVLNSANAAPSTHTVAMITTALKRSLRNACAALVPSRIHVSTARARRAPCAKGVDMPYTVCCLRSRSSTGSSQSDELHLGF